MAQIDTVMVKQNDRLIALGKNPGQHGYLSLAFLCCPPISNSWLRPCSWTFIALENTYDYFFMLVRAVSQMMRWFGFLVHHLLSFGPAVAPSCENLSKTYVDNFR